MIKGSRCSNFVYSIWKRRKLSSTRNHHFFGYGKRIKRGLYKTKDGILINADVNGASNILRKAIPHAFDEIQDFDYLIRTVYVVKIK